MFSFDCSIDLETFDSKSSNISAIFNNDLNIKIFINAYSSFDYLY